VTSDIIKDEKNVRKEATMERKQYTPEYKAKIVLEMLREETSVSEIASRENINKNQLQNWKKEFIENSSRVFAQNKLEKEAERKIRELEEKEREYQAKVGQLVIENDWLKKKHAQVYGSGWEVKFGYKQ